MDLWPEERRGRNCCGIITMPRRTGLPQHLVDRIIRGIPEDQRTVGTINAALEDYLKFSLPHNKRRTVTNVQIVDLYVKEHLTIREIGYKVGLSSFAVRARLKKLGIKKEDGLFVKVNCATCGNEIIKRRCQVRGRSRFYCNLDTCFALSRERPSRVESKLARAVVAQHFRLQPEHIVVNKDGDTKNNDRANLMVIERRLDPRQRKGLVVLWDGEVLLTS